MKEETKVLLWAGIALLSLTALHSIILAHFNRKNQEKSKTFDNASQDAQNAILEANRN